MSRDEAYRVVQAAAQEAWDEGTPFAELIAEAAPELELDLDPAPYLRHAPELIARLERLRET